MNQYFKQESDLKKSNLIKEFTPETEIFLDDFVIAHSFNKIAPKLAKFYLVVADDENYYIFDKDFKAQVYPINTKEIEKLEILTEDENFEDIFVYNLGFQEEDFQPFDVTVEVMLDSFASFKARKIVQRPLYAKQCAMRRYSILLNDTKQDLVNERRDKIMQTAFERTHKKLQDTKILTHVAPAYTLRQLVATCAILNQEYIKQAINLAQDIEKVQKSQEQPERTM